MSDWSKKTTMFVNTAKSPKTLNLMKEVLKDLIKKATENDEALRVKSEAEKVVFGAFTHSSTFKDSLGKAKPDEGKLLKAQRSLEAKLEKYTSEARKAADGVLGKEILNSLEMSELSGLEDLIPKDDEALKEIIDRAKSVEKVLAEKVDQAKGEFEKFKTTNREKFEKMMEYVEGNDIDMEKFLNLDDSAIGGIMDRGGKTILKPGHATDRMFSLDLFGMKLDYSKVLNSHEKIDELKKLISGAVSPLRDSLAESMGLPDTNLVKVVSSFEKTDPVSMAGKSFDFNVDGVKPEAVLDYVEQGLAGALEFGKMKLVDVPGGGKAVRIVAPYLNELGNLVKGVIER